MYIIVDFGLMTLCHDTDDDGNDDDGLWWHMTSYDDKLLDVMEEPK